MTSGFNYNNSVPIGIIFNKNINEYNTSVFSILNYFMDNTLHTDIYNKGRLNFKYSTDNNIRGDIMFSNDLYCIGGIKTKNYSNSELINSFAWLTKGKQYNEFDPIGNPSHDNVILYILGGRYNNENIQSGKTIQIKDGTQGNRKVLTSDNNGVASWDYVNYGTGNAYIVDLSDSYNFAVQTGIGIYIDDEWSLSGIYGGYFIIDMLSTAPLQRNINIILPHGNELENINMAEYSFRISNIYDENININIIAKRPEGDIDLLALTTNEKMLLKYSIETPNILNFTVKIINRWWYVIKREFMQSPINKVNIPIPYIPQM